MSSLEDHHGGKQKYNGTKYVETNYYCYHAKRCLKTLYKYSFGSFIHSMECCPCVGNQKCTCTCFQSNKPTNTDTEIEMVDFSNSKPNREISGKVHDSKESYMKKAINRHYQSHLKKWDQHQKFPWKVILHILLVILVTIQVS